MVFSRPMAIVSAAILLSLPAASSIAGVIFRFEIGPAFAANAPNMKKGTAFAVRALACATPAKPQVIAFAHAFVNGARQSAILDLVPLETAGAYAVPYPSLWPRGTAGVVSLVGTCDSAHTGAVVTLGPNGFVRESSKLLDRAPSEADVDEALAALKSTGAR